MDKKKKTVQKEVRGPSHQKSLTEMSETDSRTVAEIGGKTTGSKAKSLQLSEIGQSGSRPRGQIIISGSTGPSYRGPGDRHEDTGTC